MELKFRRTDRGFKKIEFKDRYKEGCSIQMSSLAEEDAIWFGIDHPEIRYRRENQVGWTIIPEDKFTEMMKSLGGYWDAYINSRMHLTQDQVKELLPTLQYFAANGTLPDSEDDLRHILGKRCGTCALWEQWGKHGVGTCQKDASEKSGGDYCSDWREKS